MSLVDSIRTCFQKYFDFSGRASRPEFWWFFLCAFLAQAILGALLPGVAFLVLLSPFLAVSARRLHDTGRSAWWLLSYLAAGIGAMVLAAAAFAIAFAGEGPVPEVDSEVAGFATLLGLLLLALAAGAICGLLPLVLCALPGTAGTNRYGSEPSAAEPEPGAPVPAATAPGPEEPGIEKGAEGPRYCAQCGASLTPEANFCPGCGVAV